jgi:hypothetical protein
MGDPGFTYGDGDTYRIVDRILVETKQKKSFVRDQYGILLPGGLRRIPEGKGDERN